MPRPLSAALILILILAGPAARGQETRFSCRSDLAAGHRKDVGQQQWISTGFSNITFTLQGDWTADGAETPSQLAYRDAVSAHELTCGPVTGEIWPGLVICGLRFEPGPGRMPWQLVFSPETGRFEFYRGSLGGYAFVDDAPDAMADSSALFAGSCIAE